MTTTIEPCYGPVRNATGDELHTAYWYCDEPADGRGRLDSRTDACGAKHLAQVAWPAHAPRRWPRADPRRPPVIA